MNNIRDFYASITEVIQGVKTGKINVDQAKAINELLKTGIDGARVEVEHAKVTGAHSESGFIPSQVPDPAPLAQLAPMQPALPKGVTRTIENRDGVRVTRNMAR